MMQFIKTVGNIYKLHKKEMDKREAYLVQKMAIIKIIGVMKRILVNVCKNSDIRKICRIYYTGKFSDDLMFREHHRKGESNLNKFVDKIAHTIYINEGVLKLMKSISKIKRVLIKFVILHRARKYILNQYWEALLLEYRVLIRRFRLLSFASVLEDCVRMYEGIEMYIYKQKK